ncbi:hypothetical protein [Luteimonas sp. e5]
MTAGQARIFGPLIAAAAALAACSAQAPAAAVDADIASGTDTGTGKNSGKGNSLHAVYWGRWVRADGDPDAIRSYNERVRICQAAGLGVKPLSDSDVEKLGKQHYERWMDAQRNVVVTHGWELASAPGDSLAASCQFSLQEKKTVDGLDASWEIHPVAADTLASIHQQNIAAGWTREGVKTVLGQPCVVWVKGGNRLCLLDAPQLGFVDDVRVHENCAMTGDAGVEATLALEHVQAEEKRHCEFKVESIELGQPLDASQWQAAARGAE